MCYKLENIPGDCVIKLKYIPEDCVIKLEYKPGDCFIKLVLFNWNIQPGDCVIKLEYRPGDRSPFCFTFLSNITNSKLCPAKEFCKTKVFFTEEFLTYI